MPALRKAVHSPRIERWSGAAFDLPDELELFLVTNAPNMAMLHVSENMVEQGVFAASAQRGVPVLVEEGSHVQAAVPQPALRPGGSPPAPLPPTRRTTDTGGLAVDADQAPHPT